MLTLADLPPLLCYHQNHKDEFLAAAIMHGFDIKHWRPVGDAKPYPGEWIHVINSLQHGAFQILNECRKRDLHYIFIDNCYINNHFTSDWMKRMYRVVPNAFQHHWIPQIYQEDRYDYHFMADITEICRPWMYGRGNHILIIPQSSWESNELFDLRGWAAKTYDRLLKIGYKNRIVFRQKGMYRQSLEIDLLNAQACIAYTSNVAVDAVRLGIPTFCSQYSAACPVTGGFGDMEIQLEHSNLGIIPEPENKLTWLQGLMCGQFTHTEISNGFAKEMVLNEMLRRLNANEVTIKDV